MPKLKTKAEFVKQARAVHGTVYDYSESVYVNAGIKVTITCLTCGHVFEQIYQNAILYSQQNPNPNNTLLLDKRTNR